MSTLIGETKAANELFDFFLKEFEKKFPGNVIGKIEVWNRFGFMSYKRKQTRSEWKKQLAKLTTPTKDPGPRATSEER